MTRNRTWMALQLAQRATWDLRSGGHAPEQASQVEFGAPNCRFPRLTQTHAFKLAQDLLTYESLDGECNLCQMDSNRMGRP